MKEEDYDRLMQEILRNRNTSDSRMQNVNTMITNLVQVQTTFIKQNEAISGALTEALKALNISQSNCSAMSEEVKELRKEIQVMNKQQDKLLNLINSSVVKIENN